MQVPPWLKPGIWGAVIGAVAMVTVGFAQFGWKTGSAAESLAQARADVAVASALVPFCIAKAQQASASDSLTKFQNSAVVVSDRDRARSGLGNSRWHGLS